MAVFKDFGPNDAKEYDAFIKNTPKSSFVKFFSPGCGYCIAMADAWLALKKNEESNKCDINIIAVDAGAISKITSESVAGVSGYPTLRELLPGGKVGDEYSGDRTTAAMVDFIKKIHNKANNNKPKTKTKTNNNNKNNNNNNKNKNNNNNNKNNNNNNNNKTKKIGGARRRKRCTKRVRKNNRRKMTRRKRAL